MTATGWKLDPVSREVLLGRFPPHWPDVIADHVTLVGDAPANEPLPAETLAEVIGHADDGRGLQVLVVMMGGSVRRPDGSIFHITWSLDKARGRKAVESNELLLQHGWMPLGAGIAIALVPACF